MQNLPSFTAPHEQVQLPPWGRGVPHSVQNLPSFWAPHLGHAHPAAGAGLGFPQFMQNLPVFWVPHSQVQPPWAPLPKPPLSATLYAFCA